VRRRSASSSPTGLSLSRPPRAGSWRGPAPRRRVTPPPVLGDFLHLGSLASSPETEPAPRLQTVVQRVVSADVTGGDRAHAAPLHGTDRSRCFGWQHLVRRFRSLWGKLDDPRATAPSSIVPSTSPPSASSPPPSLHPPPSWPGPSSSSPAPPPLSVQPATSSSPFPFDRSFAAVVATGLPRPMAGQRPQGGLGLAGQVQGDKVLTCQCLQIVD
jgi:hypothetical protein